MVIKQLLNESAEDLPCAYHSGGNCCNSGITVHNLSAYIIHIVACAITDHDAHYVHRLVTLPILAFLPLRLNYSIASREREPVWWM